MKNQKAIEANIGRSEEHDIGLSLTKAGMLISEQTLNKMWKDENDEDWSQCLKAGNTK
jgi:hypothetical protein